VEAYDNHSRARHCGDDFGGRVTLDHPGRGARLALARLSQGFQFAPRPLCAFGPDVASYRIAERPAHERFDDMQQGEATVECAGQAVRDNGLPHAEGTEIDRGEHAADAGGEVLEIGGAGMTGGYDEDGNGRFAQNPLGGGAEERFACPSAAVCAHDDEVGVLNGGEMQNLDAGLAFRYGQSQLRHPRWALLKGVVEKPLELLAAFSLELSGAAGPRRGSGEERVVNRHDGQTGIEVFGN
jgi:hypothetical protein